MGHIQEFSGTSRSHRLAERKSPLISGNYSTVSICGRRKRVCADAQKLSNRGPVLPLIEAGSAVSYGISPPFGPLSTELASFARIGKVCCLRAATDDLE
jgi:hypothetical protein